MQDLTKISFEGKIMLRFTEKVLNFWIEGLPKDVHYSLSLNKNSPDINFHITREVDNSGNKPKYEVFVIARDMCNDLENDIGRYLLSKILREFDTTKIKGTLAPKFISHDNLEKSDFYFFVEKKMNHLASNSLKYKGRKELRVKNNVADELEKFTPDKSAKLAFAELLDAAPELTEVDTKSIQSGIIVTKKSVYSVILYNGKWYTPNNNIALNELIVGFCGEKLARELFYRTKKGIAIVRKASSFEEVKHLYNRFRIIRTQHT